MPRSTVEVTARYHPTGDRFLTREYTKNGEHRRFKIDHETAVMVQEHIKAEGTGPGQVIFPVRLFASTEAAGRTRLTQAEIDSLGCGVQTVERRLRARPEARSDRPGGPGVVARLAERPDRVPWR